MFVVFAPLQTWAYARDRARRGGHGRPEARFLLSLGLVWLFPISLFWFAFTSNGNTSFWSPVVAGVVLEIGDSFLWLNMLNYITDSYPNVAASAIAAFLIPSFLIAAGCVHVGKSECQRDIPRPGCVVGGLVLISLSLQVLSCSRTCPPRGRSPPSLSFPLGSLRWYTSCTSSDPSYVRGRNWRGRSNGNFPPGM
jgi:hypothetical protein